MAGGAQTCRSHGRYRAADKETGWKPILLRFGVQGAVPDALAHRIPPTHSVFVIFEIFCAKGQETSELRTAY